MYQKIARVKIGGKRCASGDDGAIEFQALPRFHGTEPIPNCKNPRQRIGTALSNRDPPLIAVAKLP